MQIAIYELQDGGKLWVGNPGSWRGRHSRGEQLAPRGSDGAPAGELPPCRGLRRAGEGEQLLPEECCYLPQPRLSARPARSAQAPERHRGSCCRLGATFRGRDGLHSLL